MIHTIELPYTTPSINEVAVGTAATRGAAMKSYRLKVRLQHDMHFLLIEAQVPRGLRRVIAAASLRFPRAHIRRDEGNYRAWLEKALGDCLTAGGWLTDDTPDQFRFAEVRFEGKGTPRTVVHLDCL